MEREGEPLVAYEELRETPLCREMVFHGALIDVSHIQVRLPNGHTALREVVEHMGGAAVVPVDEQELVTLVRQHRVAVDLFTLEIPAGKMDRPGEDPFACARRELGEETGLEAEQIELLTSMAPTPGFCAERTHIFLATGLRQRAAHLDTDEFLNVERVPLREAVDRVMSGELCDAKTALGLLMAWQRLHGGCTPAINM